MIMNSDTHKALGLEEAKEIGDQLLSSGVLVRFRLDGVSMFPFLRAGDVAQVMKTPFNELKPGEIIVFEQEGRWLAHRLVKIVFTNKVRSIIAQGDSVLRPDKLIGEGNYLGTLKTVERNGRVRSLESSYSRFYASLMVFLRPLPQVFCRILVRLRSYSKRLARLLFGRNSPN